MGIFFHPTNDRYKFRKNKIAKFVNLKAVYDATSVSCEKVKECLGKYK